MVLGLSCRKIQRVPKKSQNGEYDPELKITFKLEKATSLKKMEVDVDFKHETEQKCCKRNFWLMNLHIINRLRLLKEYSLLSYSSLSAPITPVFQQQIMTP